MDDVLIVLPQAESTTSDYVTTNDVNTVLPQTESTTSDYLVRSIEECSWEPKILIPTQECAQE